VFRGIAVTERAANGRARRPGWIAAQVAAAAVLVTIGVLVGLQISGKKLGRANDTAPAVAVVKPAVSPELADARDELERYRQLAKYALRETGQNTKLRELLAAAEQRAAALEAAIQAANQKLNDQSQELSRTTADLTAARTGLTEARSSAESNLATMVELRYKLTEAEARLKDTSDSLDRERQMLAADREIRDIMGARDVHIVDVFDIDGKGRTKKAFGRAFYTQGKSLIFYAFDLPIPKNDKGEFSYYAWGRNSTAGRGPTHRLGIFYNDDHAQRRWTMKFDDPKVLAEIDTVFVTLEPTSMSQDHTRPTGKPILDAYFGTPPNHP
jgi:flagellar hook-basal body complex protein FliE